MSASPAVPPAPIRLDPLGPRGTHRARTTVPVTDVGGAHVAELGMVPSLYVTRTLTALRRARPLPLSERIAALGRAGELFARGAPDGLRPQEYEVLVSRVSGVPLPVVRAATVTTARRLAGIRRTVDAGRPAGAVWDWRDPATAGGSAVWGRRGDVFGVHASGVHPGAHGLWPEALALGYRVAVRPTRREPFTPHRMVAALREAGFGPDAVVLLPTGSEAADVLVRGVDLAYGGDEVIRTYSDDPRILTQEPGRSKILLTADTDWRDHLDTIVESVAHHGGAGCVNATALLVEGDPVPVAEAVAERLAALPVLPPDHEDAVLPVQAVAAARALESFLRSKADGARALLGGDGIVEELPSGGAALRPAVHLLERCTDPRVETELPFPCLWVAPWSRSDGTAPLRGTLTLTVLTRDDELVDAVLDEPGITNVHVGGHPTCWTDVAMPHDGYLAEFLMRSRAVIRD
jgi:hypothetical protein